jgi:hypothetical protein
VQCADDRPEHACSAQHKQMASQFFCSRQHERAPALSSSATCSLVPAAILDNDHTTSFFRLQQSTGPARAVVRWAGRWAGQAGSTGWQAQQATQACSPPGPDACSVVRAWVVK